MLGNGGVVIGKLAVVGQPGFMAQQLTQGERPLGDNVVEPDQAITHQGQGRGCDGCLAEAPPGHPNGRLLSRDKATIDHEGKLHALIARDKDAGGQTIERVKRPPV